jgi:hypothetical protein
MSLSSLGVSRCHMLCQSFALDLVADNSAKSIDCRSSSCSYLYWFFWRKIFSDVENWLCYLTAGTEMPVFHNTSRNNQHNARICTTALFYTLAPTSFGSSLPFSGSFWICLNYAKIQIDMVVFHIIWLSGLCVRQTGHLTILYNKPLYQSVFSRNSGGSRSSLKMADYCRNM